MSLLYCIRSLPSFSLTGMELYTEHKFPFGTTALNIVFHYQGRSQDMSRPRKSQLAISTKAVVLMKQNLLNEA